MATQKRLTLLQQQREKLKKQRSLATTSRAKNLLNQKINQVNVRILDTQKLLKGSSSQTALPPKSENSSLAKTDDKPRRRNVTDTTSRSGTQQASRSNSTRTNQPQLRSASTPKGTSKPTDGRKPPTRMETAKAKAASAAQGSSSSTLRIARQSPQTKTGGLGGALIAKGLIEAGSPLAEGIGYETAKAIRKALGGGEPTLDSKGNKIKKPVYKGTGLKGPDGKPLPAPSAAFKKLILSKVPKSNDTSKPESKSSTSKSESKTKPSSTTKTEPTAKVTSKPKPKSKIHTYKKHGSDLHIGRHKTIKQHEKAVAARKAAEKKDRKTPSAFGPRA
jgi:hypothetical protein